MTDDHRTPRGPTSGTYFARFDDVRANQALVFAAAESSSEPLVARRLDEVVPLIREVERATGAGAWAAGFVAYEAAAAFDPALTTWPVSSGDPFGELPLAWFALFPTPGRESALTSRGAGPSPYRVDPWRLDLDTERYRRDVALIRDEIEAGNTYQCNLTAPLRSRVRGELFELYRDLVMAQRASYNAYLECGRYVVASASPELFFEWRGDRVTARPMKGTVARGRVTAEDLAQAAALETSAKERAENVMIVDLIRNDLAKFARVGSVEVPRLCELERYETLWQLTSTVVARTSGRVGLETIFSATFPCGSITGAPKSSTMALIAQLERRPRGIYCGAIGIVAPPGADFRARFSVAIRTITIDRRTDDAVYGSGGGITWDSDWRREHDELVAKAAVLEAPRGEFELIETMGYRPDEGLRNLDRHLARLADSARFFGFAFDEARIRTSLDQALEMTTEAQRVRLVLDRAGTPAVTLAPMPGAAADDPVVAIDREPMDTSTCWVFHKTTRRSAYEARAARHLDCADVILVNERGELTETTIANLAVELDSTWWTPPIESGCLPGVERARLVAGGVLHERVLVPTDLERATGLAVVNSLRGWRSVRLAEQRPRDESGRPQGQP